MAFTCDVREDKIEKMNKLPAAKLLVESGLLFEINRKIMHPRGLALEVIEQGDGTLEMSQDLQDHRDEGIEFSENSVKLGEQKLLEWSEKNIG